MKVFADLDLIGREDMEKELYVIVKGAEGHLKPSGIRCRLCPLMDDGWDPVVLAIRGVKTYTKWCKPPFPDGRTQGHYCRWCYNYWAKVISRSCVTQISIVKYEAELGRDTGKLLLKHQCIIVNAIKKQIDTGDMGKLDWSEIDRAATETELKVVNSQQFVKEQVQSEVWELVDYIEEYGDLEVNGMKSKGHRREKVDGKDSVVVPKRGPALLKTLDISEYRRETHLGSTKDGLSLAQLIGMQNGVAASMCIESSGGDAGAVARALEIDAEEAGFSGVTTHGVAPKAAATANAKAKAADAGA